MNYVVTRIVKSFQKKLIPSLTSQDTLENRGREARYKRYITSNHRNISLAASIKIQNLLQQALDQGASLADDIIDCGDAYLYYTSTAELSAQAKAPLGEKFYVIC